MQFKVVQSIDNGVYSLLFSNVISRLSEKDKRLMEEFGQPTIDVGGIFLSSTDDEFRFPNEYKELRAGFPFTRTFDTKDDEFADNIEVKVENYRDTIMSRLSAAATALRGNDESFIGEIVVNVGDDVYINANAIEFWIVGEIPTGSINNVNDTFTTIHQITSQKLVCYLNGLRTHPSDITFLSLNQFRLSDPPIIGDHLVIDYVTQS